MTTEEVLVLSKRAMATSDQEEWPNDTFLNKEALRVSSPTPPENHDQVEWHPLIPFLPVETRVLFLGSFPPQRKRWCMDFFYPNFINDHWRIEGLIFKNDAQYFVDEQEKTFRLKAIVEHLKQYGIGFFDTALAVRRLADNASDKDLEVVVPTDVQTIVEYLTSLRAIVTTGEKATATITRALGIWDKNGRINLPKVGSYMPSPFHGIELYRLPSSSRAYPMALQKKGEAYKKMFERYLT